MTPVSSMTQIRVCTVDDVPAGEGIRVELDALPEPIAVFNDEGRFYALSDMCSHAEASLAEGEVANCQVECPLHWGRFDLATGRARALPALMPVKAYQVTLSGDEVYVNLPTVGGS
jgi:nitrite reductase/ring-hydroxylating ferredoxin subunit